jgi:subtilisin-like proprotein convertase family protein
MVNRPLFIMLVIALCLNLLPLPAPVQANAATPQGQPTAPKPDVNSLPSQSNPVQPAIQTPLPAGINFAPGYSKVLIDNADKTALNNAARNGGLMLVDYVSFSLWKIPASPGLNGLTPQSGIENHAEFDRIELRSGALDTNQASPAVAGLAALEPQLWLVQFVGPIKQEWLDRLAKLGIEVVIYMPSNAYVIWANSNQLGQVAKQVNSGNTELQWSGPYKPDYRLDPVLKNRKDINTATPVKVTVQFYTTPTVQDSLNRLQQLGGQVIQPPFQVLKFTNITLVVPANRINDISRWPDVFNVEQWYDRTKNDEVQGQIVAGNISATGGKVGPAAPGYLSWLSGLGFPTTPADYPIVDVVDDGVDNGTTNPLHPDFYTNGNKVSGISRLVDTANCTTDPAADGLAGHGNLNAGIVGAYNNLTGQPYVDSNGFNRGVGISPFGRIAETKIFKNAGNYDIANCGDTDAGVVLKSYQKGALITSNSWGADGPGVYDTSAQAYDSLTRDAASGVAGNQPMLHIFSAGNRGPNNMTIGSPGTAKNVLTVGATENVRDGGIVDGCGTSTADNADEMAGFSSRGPTSDGRVKPDIVAPGTHIQGPASQDPGYDGSGVCGAGSGDKRYYPNLSQPPGQTISQTLYTWSSGTSHSTPAVAGGMSLLYNYYGRVLAPGQTPSPAMAKALMLNAPRYLNGSGTGDTLPSNSQGWGDLNLGGLFDGVQRYMVDQSTVFTATGQQFVQIETVHDTTKPVRVTLAWTDAPGSTSGNSYVNNLDLQVTINGQIYKGNVFNGAFSATGGASDTRNNIENVFLPAGTRGTFSVKVLASNLAGDGVPGNATSLDQDFALVVYNGEVSPPAAVLAQDTLTLSGGDGDAYAEPGESLGLSIGILNGGNAAANNVTGSLVSNTPGVTVTVGTSNYGDIAAGATVVNTAPAYHFTIDPGLACGSYISFTHTISYNGGATVAYVQTITYQLGAPQVSGTAITYTSTDVPKTIITTTATIVTSTLPVNFSGQVGKIRATINISHTWDSDLTITLINPDGIRVILSANHGSSGDDYTNTVFDDSAALAISSGTPPFSGTFRPDQPLSSFYPKPATGNWKLEVVDSYSGDGGSLNSWKLEVFPVEAICNASPSGSITPTAGNPQNTPVSQIFATPLQVKVIDGSNNPVNGAGVTFSVQAGSTGASGSFGSNSSATATTDASGIATAPALTANNIAGDFTIAASVAGNYSPATFNLSNTPAAPCDLTVITGISDDGTASTCGTLSYAFEQLSANSNITLTFSLSSGRTIDVSGNGFRDHHLPAKINLDGVNCADPIVLNRSGTNANIDGLTLNGSQLRAITVTNFTGRQIVTNNGPNQLTCVKAIKSTLPA